MKDQIIELSKKLSSKIECLENLQLFTSKKKETPDSMDIVHTLISLDFSLVASTGLIHKSVYDQPLKLADIIETQLRVDIEQILDELQKLRSKADENE